jgi:hypothetical protein
MDSIMKKFGTLREQPRKGGGKIERFNKRNESDLPTLAREPVAPMRVGWH